MALSIKYITYVSEYGSSPTTNSALTTLDETHLPSMTADGYKFLGWYYTSTFDDGTKAEVGDTVSDSITLYAKWEPITIKSTMTALADKIRILSGTEDAMGLDAMTTHVGTANDNVATEADLIAQINSALEGKAGGGSNELTVVTGTYTPDTTTYDIYNYPVTITGLPFTPKSVLFRVNPANTGTTIYLLRGFGNLLIATAGDLFGNFSSSVSPSSANATACSNTNSTINIEIIENGFILSSTSSTEVLSLYEYVYYAIG